MQKVINYFKELYKNDPATFFVITGLTIILLIIILTKIRDKIIETKLGKLLAPGEHEYKKATKIKTKEADKFNKMINEMLNKYKHVKQTYKKDDYINYAKDMQKILDDKYKIFISDKDFFDLINEAVQNEKDLILLHKYFYFRKDKKDNKIKPLQQFIIEKIPAETYNKIKKEFSKKFDYSKFTKTFFNIYSKYYPGIKKLIQLTN